MLIQKMRFLNSIFFFILLSINHSIHLFYVAATETDVLRQGDQGDDDLVSAGGTFTIGHYGIGSDDYADTAYYLAMWYTDDRSIIPLLWIANGGIPMFRCCPILKLDESGTLKVIDPSNNMTVYNIYISNKKVGSGKVNTFAVLEDSGNFVLYDNTTDNILRVLWQSFDHPTNTLLPGMKLGFYNQQNWTLTSWLRYMYPVSGAFTMSLELINNSHKLVIYRHGKLYWTSDSWIEDGGGSGSFKFGNNIINGSLLSDASGMYFSIHNKSISGGGGRSFLQLSALGELIDGDKNILTPSTCYGYAYDGGNKGCAISGSQPKCRDEYDSIQLEAGQWDGPKIHSVDNPNISLSDCMEICWKDCRCRGFAIETTGKFVPDGNDGSLIARNKAGCYTYGVNAEFSPDKTSTLIIGGVLTSQNLLKKKKSKRWIWIVSAAIVVSSLLVAFFYCLWVRRRRLKESRRADYIHQLTGSDSFNYGDELVKSIKDTPDVNIFSLKAISAATCNFSNENKLGQGGYGPVYKGILFDGRQIAVKRLSNTSGQGIMEFKSELILISKLQHTNLVRLYGCCIHQEEKMLIYEFMPNKSLDSFLFVEDVKKKIDWQMRFNIIEGVAQGLLYLHNYSRMMVIHRDLKVSNVLLDENMNPKIADFGMARIFQRNVTEEITNRVVGTYGYMAPEYAARGTFSIKSDVFSFGVLIFEIVSGKKNSRFYSLDRALNLLGYAWELWKRETSLELKDESLGESYDLNQLLRTIHVALLCVQENADDRPAIQEVISMLNNEITSLPIPKQPAYFASTSSVEVLDKNIPASINGLTITTMEAR